MRKLIQERIKSSIEVKNRLLHDETVMEGIVDLASRIVASIQQGGKVLFFGNGGSASDAQHLACEFVVKLKDDRRPLPALALTVNTSILTAAANDYSFEAVFSRQVEALGKKGDIAIGISTSGNSSNVIAALASARKKGLVTVVLTGQSGGAISGTVDIEIKVPSDVTAHIQEAHILIGHILCELVEKNL